MGGCGWVWVGVEGGQKKLDCVQLMCCLLSDVLDGMEEFMEGFMDG